MKIDIILICYNQEQYIQQALDGIMIQRLNVGIDVRVLIADDCSNDNTLGIIRSYEERSPFPFVYLYSEKNIGHVLNYKRAFAACEGDYVCVLEGDDYWSSPLHIENLVGFLELHYDCSMAVNRLVEYYPDQKLFSIPTNKYSSVKFYNVYDQIAENHIGNHSSACYRTKILKELPENFFNEMYDDYLLGVYMAQYGFIVQLPYTSSVYRIHAQGVYSGEDREQHMRNHISRIEYAKVLFHEKYNCQFDLAKENIMTQIEKKKYSWRDYISPFMFSLYRLFVPLRVREFLRTRI